MTLRLPDDIDAWIIAHCQRTRLQKKAVILLALEGYRSKTDAEFKALEEMQRRKRK
jgi:hypothetical protein